MTALFMMVSGAFALADTIESDSDVLDAGVQSNTININLVAGGSTNVPVGVQVIESGGQHASFPVAVAASTSNVTGTPLGTPSPTSLSVGAYGDAGMQQTSIPVTAPASGSLTCGVTNQFVGRVTFSTSASGFQGANNTDTVQINVNVPGPACAPTNAAPTITSASFGGPVGCRVAATLTVTFSDPDSTSWSANIDWEYNGTVFAPDELVSPIVSGAEVGHTYNSPGTYTAAVRVTDGEGATSAIATAQITVNQTYAVDFLPPFDDSTPSGLIVNKMKNGRVVPVKVTLFDECSLSPVTDPTTAVTIFVSKTSGTSGTADPVEEYADAGASSAGTDAFRWSTDGFWIYNLDSKALGLVVNNYYRVDVYVGAVKATVDNWGVLQPVK